MRDGLLVCGVRWAMTCAILDQAWAIVAAFHERRCLQDGIVPETHEMTCATQQCFVKFLRTCNIVFCDAMNYCGNVEQCNCGRQVFL